MINNMSFDDSDHGNNPLWSSESSHSMSMDEQEEVDDNEPTQENIPVNPESLKETFEQEAPKKKKLPELKQRLQDLEKRDKELENLDPGLSE